MKTIALLPVKNEEWILPTFISSLNSVADHIIAVDDFSTDDSYKILEAAGATVITNPYPTKKGWAEYKIRQKLLDLGREHGGTHFICIDADEALTANFAKTGLPYLKKMNPGDKLSLQWLALWKSPLVYRDDKSIWSNLQKIVIFCDDQESNFINLAHFDYNDEAGQRPHIVGPTPHVANGTIRKMPLKDGALLHYQFADWEHYQWKQVQKRCLELIQRPDDARRINNTYRITLDSPAKCTPIPENWLVGIRQPSPIPEMSWQEKDVWDWVEEYGIEFFEPLQIWHIPELYKCFKEKTGRNPKSITYPQWLIFLNEMRHKIKRFVNSI